jgi:hypothetical protein
MALPCPAPQSAAPPHARCRFGPCWFVTVNKAPTSTLVAAMAAIAPDVTDSSNAFLYFFDGQSLPPSSTLLVAVASTQKYNMLLDSWTSVMKVPSRRQAIQRGGEIPSAYGGAATVGTIIYAISSGYPAAPNPPAGATPVTCSPWGCGVNEAYQTVTDTWATKTPMPLEITRGTLVAAQGNRVFAFAASSTASFGTQTHARKDVNKYDATTDKWTSCARARRCRCTCGRAGFCAYSCVGVCR